MSDTLVWVVRVVCKSPVTNSQAVRVGTTWAFATSRFNHSDHSNLYLLGFQGLGANSNHQQPLDPKESSSILLTFFHLPDAFRKNLIFSINKTLETQVVRIRCFKHFGWESCLFSCLPSLLQALWKEMLPFLKSALLFVLCAFIASELWAFFENNVVLDLETKNRKTCIHLNIDGMHGNEVSLGTCHSSDVNALSFSKSAETTLPQSAWETSSHIYILAMLGIVASPNP